MFRQTHLIFEVMGMSTKWQTLERSKGYPFFRLFSSINRSFEEQCLSKLDRERTSLSGGLGGAHRLCKLFSHRHHPPSVACGTSLSAAESGFWHFRVGISLLPSASVGKAAVLTTRPSPTPSLPALGDAHGMGWQGTAQLGTVQPRSRARPRPAAPAPAGW